MMITERDLFDYVHDKPALQAEKILFIEEHLSLFIDEISFYRDMKDSFNESLPPEADSALQRGLATKMIFELFPLNIKSGKDKLNRFAADSFHKDESVKALSFADKDSKHIIRALFFQDKTELFVLTSENKKLENFSLVTKPSQKQYYFSDNQHSVATAEKVIEQIDILYH